MYVKQCEQLVTIIQVKKPRRSAVADYRMTLPVYGKSCQLRHKLHRCIQETTQQLRLAFTTSWVNH